MNDPQVRIQHIRSAKLCMGGARAWFTKYGLSWSTFLSSGYPASVLEATGDHFAERVCTIARQESGRG